MYTYFYVPTSLDGYVRNINVAIIIIIIMSSGLHPTPISLLTGAGRLVQRAPPRPKCDRVDFNRKIRSTPWRI